MNTGKPVSLNLNVRGIGVSPTLGINEKCKALQDSGRHVYRLGLGQSPFPVPDSVVEALRLAAPEKDYLPVRGLPALREAVAAFHSQHDGVSAHADGVLIGPGSKELMFLLQLAFYGEIIVPSPCWVSYLPQARIVGRTVKIIETAAADEWKLTADLLEQSFRRDEDDWRPRLLVLNYPSNPTGLTHAADELEAIAEVARRFGTIVLSDEIYGHLHHKGEHTSIARYYPEGTIISSGLSKWCGAGGWRLGTFTFPEDLDWLLDAMAAVASETYTSVSAPIQYAAVRAFRGGVDIERYLWHARRILRALATRCVTRLRDTGVDVPDPDGAFYLFLRFESLREKLAERGIHTGAALAARLLEDTGVAILPGSSFARPSGELTARLAYVSFDGAAALTASETIPLHEALPRDFIDHWCQGVTEALDRLCDWLA